MKPDDKLGSIGMFEASINPFDPDCFQLTKFQEGKQQNELLCWHRRGRGEPVLRTVPRLPEVALQQRIRQIHGNRSRKGRGRGRARLWKGDHSESSVQPGQDMSRGSSQADLCQVGLSQPQPQEFCPVVPVYTEPQRLYNGAWFEHDFPDLSSQGENSKRSECLSGIELDTSSHTASQTASQTDSQVVIPPDTQEDQSVTEQLSVVEQIRMLEMPRKDLAARPKTSGSRSDFVEANVNLFKSFESLNKKKKTTKVLPLTQSNLEKFLQNDYISNSNTLSYVSMYCDQNQYIDSEGRYGSAAVSNANNSHISEQNQQQYADLVHLQEPPADPSFTQDGVPFDTRDKYSDNGLVNGETEANNEVPEVHQSGAQVLNNDEELTENYIEVYYEEARSLDSLVSNLSDTEFDIDSSELDECLKYADKEYCISDNADRSKEVKDMQIHQEIQACSVEHTDINVPVEEGCNERTVTPETPHSDLNDCRESCTDVIYDARKSVDVQEIYPEYLETSLVNLSETEERKGGDQHSLRSQMASVSGPSINGCDLSLTADPIITVNDSSCMEDTHENLATLGELNGVQELVDDHTDETAEEENMCVSNDRNQQNQVHTLDSLDEFEIPRETHTKGPNYYDTYSASYMAQILQAEEYGNTSIRSGDYDKDIVDIGAAGAQAQVRPIDQIDSIHQGYKPKADLLDNIKDDDLDDGTFQLVTSKRRRRKSSEGKSKVHSDNAVWQLHGKCVFQVDNLPPQCDISDLMYIVMGFGHVVDSQMISRHNTASVRFKMKTRDACEQAVECLHDSECLFPDSGNSIVCYKVQDKQGP